MRSRPRPSPIGGSRARLIRRRRRTALAAIVSLVGVVVVIAWLAVGTAGVDGPRRPAAAARDPVSSTNSRDGRRDLAAAPLPLSGIPVGTWAALPQSPSSRGEVSAARLGDEVYVVGGFDTAGRTSAVVQRLDLRSERWSAVAPMPRALNHMSAIGYRGRLYVIGGYASPTDTSTDAVTGFWSYDPATRRWSTMPDAPLPRAAAGAAVIGHRLYVAGGRNDASIALASLAIFDFSTGRWSFGPSLVHAREHLAVVAAGGAVWALGGRVAGVGNADVERYRPGAAAWQSMASMPVARSGFQAATVGGSIIVVGGENGAVTVPQVDRLDLRSGRWSALPDLPVARHGLGLVADGPLVYAIDGGPEPGLTTSRLVTRLRIAGAS